VQIEVGKYMKKKNSPANLISKNTYSLVTPDFIEKAGQVKTQDRSKFGA
jgi:hypothetical protein